MRDSKFTAAQFTPTEFYTAEDKAKFCNHFVRFVRSGFKETLFHKGFYNRLSNTFGHIAHYNRAGFYHVWFSSPGNRLEFLKRTAERRIYGSPEYTFCDCERVLAEWVRNSGLVEEYGAATRLALEKAERAELARLSAKYA
jgi:hypothetical protein